MTISYEADETKRPAGGEEGTQMCKQVLYILFIYFFSLFFLFNPCANNAGIVIQFSVIIGSLGQMC